MEKLTRILAVVDKVEDGAVLLEKAVVLARRFGARIDLLLHESLHAQAFATLCSTLHYDEVTLTSVHRGATALHDIILRRVIETRPDLIMKAPAGEHPLKRWTFAANDYCLVNESPVPVLLVRHRAWASPAQFAAALDVSADAAVRIARGVLHAAQFLALGCRAKLEVVYGEDSPADGRARRRLLAQLAREYNVGDDRIQVVGGAPHETLPPFVAERRYDLLAIGAVSRQRSVDNLLGTLASRMLDATEGDVLLVNPPAVAASERAQAAPSN